MLLVVVFVFCLVKVCLIIGVKVVIGVMLVSFWLIYVLKGCLKMCLVFGLVVSRMK